MALVVLVMVGIVVAGLRQRENAGSMLVLFGCTGLLFVLGVTLNLTSSPDTAACAQQNCFFGPPNPQGVAGIILCGIALLVFVGGVFVLSPRILMASLTRQDPAAQADRERKLLERQERRRAVAASTASHAHGEHEGTAPEIG